MKVLNDTKLFPNYSKVISMIFPQLIKNPFVKEKLEDYALGVFFCNSLDLCYDPCHVVKHESQHSIFSLKKSYVIIHVYA